MIGGEYQITKSMKIISENWIPATTEIAFLSFGLRFFGESLAADLGLIHPFKADMGGFPFMPWLGFTYNFGGRK